MESLPPIWITRSISLTLFVPRSFFAFFLTTAQINLLSFQLRTHHKNIPWTRLRDPRLSPVGAQLSFIPLATVSAGGTPFFVLWCVFSAFRRVVVSVCISFALQTPPVVAVWNRRGSHFLRLYFPTGFFGFSLSRKSPVAAVGLLFFFLKLFGCF